MSAHRCSLDLCIIIITTAWTETEHTASFFIADLLTFTYYILHDMTYAYINTSLLLYFYIRFMYFQSAQRLRDRVLSAVSEYAYVHHVTCDGTKIGSELISTLGHHHASHAASKSRSAA